MTLPPRDIVRFLLLIGSPACRGDKRVMLAAVAAITGLSCRARYCGPVSENIAELLTPLVRAFQAGKLRFQRSGPRSRDPHQWEWSGTMFT
jgi:hypothetical protein